MTKPADSPTAVLAARRELLLMQCAMQRIAVRTETQALLQPIAQNSWRARLTGDLKIPLAIAGVVAGLVLVRPARTLPLISLATSLWRLSRSVMGALRREADSGE